MINKNENRCLNISLQTIIIFTKIIKKYSKLTKFKLDLEE